MAIPNMTRGSVRCLGKAAFHRMRYYDRGHGRGAPVVICVHGLTRTGRDFDALAQVLARDFRVVCPDIVGRGESDWLADKSGYAYPQYMTDLTALIASVAPGEDARVYWVGTSMGALLGMLMAALPRTPIVRLVMNDAGMRVPKNALERLALYVAKEWRFGTYEELDAHTRQAYAPFGPLTDAQWRDFTARGARQLDDGAWIPSYDPAIGNAFKGELADIDFSTAWDAIRCPTLVLRGADSDVLSRETAFAMTERGPRAELVEFGGVGHAPALVSDDQIETVRDFLMRDMLRR